MEPRHERRFQHLEESRGLPRARFEEKRDRATSDEPPAHSAVPRRLPPISARTRKLADSCKAKRSVLVPGSELVDLATRYVERELCRSFWRKDRGRFGYNHTLVPQPRPRAKGKPARMKGDNARETAGARLSSLALVELRARRTNAAF